MVLTDGSSYKSVGSRNEVMQRDRNVRDIERG